MRVRDWQDIMTDVVESSAEPQGWRAVGGDRRSGIGEDLYIGHPAVGVFQIKTYARNPYEVQGIGTQVARSVDDDIEPLFPEEGTGQFGVSPPIEDEKDAERTASKVEQVVKTHADAPTTPDAFFEDVMDAMDSPAYGPMEFDPRDRPEGVENFADTFEEAEEVLEMEFEDIVDENVDRGFY
ncbi:hypothetical protein [Halococcoides cellulosivorans]|uniref:Uncharacterized protein n=1 Tax=Halococcoides cellulosivorans TaxID=1679096 RepID=A0A2R4WXQ6_9EURY|nr:hypothetical protein [Halococcoides cellulosivorans]AWB26316.1 hypothetical protein HARCEL1_00565 [Halococcoides cellulosivorans]